MIRLTLVFIVLQMIISVDVSNAQGKINLKEKPSFAHPNRVEIPSDLPFTASTVRGEKDGGQQKTVIDFPAIGYQKWHYHGWQSCLAITANRGISAAKRHDPRGIQTDRAYILSGTLAGYQNALKVVQLHIDAGTTEAEIQRLCREAYMPSLQPPEQTEQAPRRIPAIERSP